MIAENKPFIYLYDLPKCIATSVKITEVIRKACAYELTEPVQFKDARISMYTGLLSPLINGIIKVDQKDFLTVAKAIKYFEISDGQGKVWQCRALPFDKDLIGGQKNILNLKQNVFLKKIPVDWSSKTVEETFSQIGPVKSAKISLTPVLKTETNDKGKKFTVVDETLPCNSNGYGFVCFESEEHAKALIGSQAFGAIEAIKFQPKDPKEIKRISNNVYVKNFDPTWDESKIRAIFEKFGPIKSIFVKEEQYEVKPDKNSTEPLPEQPVMATRKFSFVCFDDPEEDKSKKNKEIGFISAENAVNALNDQTIDGFKIYVAPALTAIQRQGAILRDQQRFKNSKKKCNLFVKNFPPEFGDAELRPHFANFGEIESIKILPTHDGQPSSRAFVCFKQPDSAAFARARLHGAQINGKQLYVTNYELPEIRKKQQAENKDKTDFYNQRKQIASNQIVDPSLLQRPDTIQLIQQILSLIQRQFNGRMPNMGGNNNYNNNNYGNRPQNNYNNGGNNQQQRVGGPKPYGNQGGYNANLRNPGPRTQQMYQAQPMMVAQPIVQQEIITTGMQGGPQKPLASPDEVVNNYNLKGFGYLPAVVPENPNYKAQVGEFIYEYVERFVGDQRAPKITGMLIDLPIEEIKAYLYDFAKLYTKIGDAVNLLSALQVQVGVQ